MGVEGVERVNEWKGRGEEDASRVAGEVVGVRRGRRGQSWFEYPISVHVTSRDRRVQLLAGGCPSNRAHVNFKRIECVCLPEKVFTLRYYILNNSNNKELKAFDAH